MKQELGIALGLAIGSSPYVVHLVTAGPGHVVQGMILDPVFELRGGRSLPIPPSWSHLDGFLQRAAFEQLLHRVFLGRRRHRHHRSKRDDRGGRQD